MRIALFDPYLPKFSQDMIDYWQRQGHEVDAQRYYNPSIVDWADVIWFDTSDNNILSATNPSLALLADDANFKPWDLHEFDLTGKRVVCRMIDIEVWQQHYMAPRWDLMTDIIFIAPHIRNLVDFNSLPDFNPDKTRVHTIQFGVDLNRYKFAERGPGFDIAVVSEKWSSKGTHEILQVALKLQRIDPRYKIHWLGKRSDSNWEYAYFDDFVEYHKLNIEFTNVLNDGSTVDDFLEGKNYLLHGSVKEAFSFATAEAMAKGIKPVINRFYGADNIWGDMTWSSIDEAVEMILEDEYDSNSYRQYLIDHEYTLPQYMAHIDKIINEGKI